MSGTPSTCSVRHGEHPLLPLQCALREPIAPKTLFRPPAVSATPEPEPAWRGIRVPRPQRMEPCPLRLRVRSLLGEPDRAPRTWRRDSLVAAMALVSLRDVRARAKVERGLAPGHQNSDVGAARIGPTG
jgi:hypothetical protein